MTERSMAEIWAEEAIYRRIEDRRRAEACEKLMDEHHKQNISTYPIQKITFDGFIFAEEGV